MAASSSNCLFWDSCVLTRYLTANPKIKQRNRFYVSDLKSSSAIVSLTEIADPVSTGYLSEDYGRDQAYENTLARGQ